MIYFENSLLKTMFGLESKKVTKMEKLPDCKYQNFVGSTKYSSNQSGKIESGWVMVCNTHERNSKRIQNFYRKPEGKNTLRRSRHKWQYRPNIKIDLNKQHWIH